MKKQLFETDKERDEAVLYFRALQQDPGWRLLMDVVSAKIDDLKQELEEGVENETPSDIQNRRNLLKAHRWFMEFPQNRIDEFTSPEISGEEPIVDPYDTKESLIKKRSGT
jgi:hypothetical protein